MSTGKKRVQKLESGLTPKQAMLLWLQDAHSFNTVNEYVDYLRTQPERAWPLVRLPEQVRAGVEQKLKGRLREEISPAVRQAYRHVAFLFHLHQQVNRKLAEDSKFHLTSMRMKVNDLHALDTEHSLLERMRWGRVRVEMSLPYPLDPQTADAVTAAKQHHVLTWDVVEESGDLDGWVMESFVAEGRGALPGGAYLARERGCTGRWKVPAGEELRELFVDEESLQKFLDDEDYSNGLADVPDTEYEARSCELLQAIKGLVVSGVVPSCGLVELPTVPHRFLKEAPLVEGEWIDQYVVKLAEWGAWLLKKGYQLEEPQDNHPLAWYLIRDPETGSEVDAAIPSSIWNETAKHLSRFGGVTMNINGRLYLSLSDYLKWRGRWARGDLCLQEGLSISDWNRWLHSQSRSGEATLAGVQVGKLSSYLEGYKCHECEDVEELTEEMSQRQSLLGLLSGGTRDDERRQERVEDWMGRAKEFLLELYTVAGTINSINQHYFDGQQVLFPGTASQLGRVINFMERLVGRYNRDHAERLELGTLIPNDANSDGTIFPLAIDIQGLEKMAKEAVTGQVTYLVDMAKAEALDLMGETKRAQGFVERHLWLMNTIVK